MNSTPEIYKKLLKSYGYQGWWPLLSHEGINPTKTGSIRGYHPRDYSFPKTDGQRFEICAGAILTQNSSWTQAEKALLGLKKADAVSPEKILSMKKSALAESIRPAGYFNQKAKKLIEFSRFYLSLKNRVPNREELLSVWGIGPETADSMLLYAYRQPVFVVDAYTRRVFSRVGAISGKESYDCIREFFERRLNSDYKTYQEFHALIVEHAKRHCTNKKNCENCASCPLGKECKSVFSEN